MAEAKVLIAARVANEEVSAWLPDHAVLIQDDRITAVQPADSLPSDISTTHTVHDLGDVSLLPGLVDAHCHMHCSATSDAQHLAMTENDQQLTIRAVNAMRKCVLSGTTTIRDLGARNEVAFAVKRAVDAGAVPGPRMIVAGTPITITAGHCWFFGTEADTTEEVVAAVRRQVKLGARAIKMMATGGMFTPTANPRRPQYSAETLRAAVSEAERMDVQIVAHTLSTEGIRNCVEAGIHHLIHARWHHADPTKALDYDQSLADRLSDQGQWVDPTIGHHLLAQEAAKRGVQLAPPHWAVSFRRVSEEEHIETINRMHDSGIRFTTGLDMGMPNGGHDSSAANAWAFHETLGWDRWKAIHASTAGTAEAVRVGDEVGRIRPGMIADLAAFRGDPAANIRDLGNAYHVIQSGHVIKKSGEALV